MIRSSLPEGMTEGSVHDVVGGCWESMDVLWAQKPDPDLKSLMNGMDAFYQVQKRWYLHTDDPRDWV